MGRYLSVNQGTEVPESVFFIDTESTRHFTSNDRKHFLEKFLMGCVSHVIMRENKIISRELFTFWRIKEFWNFLYSRLNIRKSNWVFAHNLAFDLQTLNIYDRLLQRELIIHEKPGDFPIGKPLASKKRPWKGLYCVDGLPCFLRVRSAKGTIVFADTLNYFRQPLSEIGNEINLPKLPFPGEFASKPQWADYCSRDVEIIEKVMIESMIQWKSKKMGNWNYTAPGLAWNNFRHHHAPFTKSKNGKQKVNIVVHDNEEAKKLERESYHGGEIQCWFVGYVAPVRNQFDARPHSDDILHHLDIRSLFPYCMAMAKYPCSLYKYIQKGTLAQLEHYARAAGVIAEVQIDTDTIPFVVTHQKQVRYAIGKFWTVLCADELGRALEEGLIRNVGRMAVYHLAPIFRDYVRYWYSKREESRLGKNPHGDRFAKMMLNSLYGKFAQKTPKWVDASNIVPDVDYGEFWHFGTNDTKPKIYRAFAGNVQEKSESVDSASSFCAVSSFVTSNAREYMRQIRELCPNRSIYYQHTDSLICNHRAYLILKKNNLIGNTMGLLREIQEPTSDAEFFGPGDYIYGREVVRSGIKASAVEESPGTITQDNFNGLNYVIARGNMGGVVGQSLTIHRTPKSEKKNAREDGWAKPFILSPELQQQQQQQQ